MSVTEVASIYSSSSLSEKRPRFLFHTANICKQLNSIQTDDKHSLNTETENVTHSLPGNCAVV